ncbi:hypothetical protein [Nocardiopsis sp. CA-288880]|uniref:hypothetical protein n=1 Tax=Nocardiopsis sp. CA-288880 TaxID=3239995 RepID=UPI003D9A0024
MSAPTSQEDLHRHGLRLLLDEDIAARVALWAEDGLTEFPLAVLETGADVTGSSR